MNMTTKIKIYNIHHCCLYENDSLDIHDRHHNP